ncbi:MAG: hypothetical protein ABIH49_02855 [archaeon]
MKRGMIYSVLLVLVLLSVAVSATDTQINVKALPNYDVTVRAEKISETADNYINSFYGDSGELGNVSFTLSSEESSFILKVWVKEENTILVYKKFEEGFPAGEPIYIEAYPEWYLKQKEIEAQMNHDSETENPETLLDTETEDAETNEPVDEEVQNSADLEEVTQEETVNENETNPNIIGSVISNSKEFLSNKLFHYVLTAIFILAILFTAGVVIAKRRHSFSMMPSFKPSNAPQKKSSNVEKTMGDDDEIRDAQRRIKEAKEEIARIKNKGKTSEKDKKIEEMKRRIVEDEKELMRLREEKD